jgi:large subunit ribosomal protein L23
MAILDFIKKRPTKEKAGNKESEGDASRGTAKLKDSTAPVLHKVIPCTLLITEKGSNLSQYRQYIFKTSPSSTKRQVCDAIQVLWKVHPINIRVLQNLGKKTRYGKALGKKKSWKKCIVALKEGEKIEMV